MTKSVKRLYKELKPTSYTLYLRPDARALTFTGTVTIRLRKTGRPGQRLTFHQHGLKIASARIIRHDKKGARELPLRRINNQNTLDEVRLHTDELLYSGEYEVFMQFSGTITRDMTGLYPCYFNVDGTQHTMLATQLESHYARELFPCIDEPEAKATFDLTLVAPDGYVVLANTPVRTSRPLKDEPSLAETTFQPTPKMSTYLLAFAIGELHRRHTRTKRGTEVSIWATIAQPAESMSFALDAAKRSIEFFEDYFGIEYPLPKADHIALPDFSSSAMENWGLITYRERALLAYPGDAAQSTLELIAEVIAHETSHQWFGNLVTMQWWDNLWLNESFANVTAYECVDALFPAWHIWNDFIAGEGLAALRRDAMSGVQAVQTGVRHPDEIGTLFDPSIVYAKGGRLLYMLKTYLGEAAFRKGLTAYFTRHAYGNTTGDDLWRALQDASGADVGAFMNPWLERAGFPVVSVDQTGRTAAITQQHFLESGGPSDGRVWPVPLLADRGDVPPLLSKAQLKIMLASDEPLILNRSAAGHYIVHYAQPAHRAHLGELVRSDGLKPAERLMLLNNASMLSKAGYQPFGDVLRLLSEYESEQAEAVWGVIALIIGETKRFIDLDEALEPALKTLTRRLIRREYARLGWDEQPGEPAADRKLRGTIIGLGAYAEDPGIVAGALARFRAYQKDPAGTNTELRSIIFSVAVREQQEGAVSFLLDLHTRTANADLQSDIAAALTATRNTQQARFLLSRLTDASLVKPQDADWWFFYLLRNRYAREVTWQWMIDNWAWIEQTYAHDKSYDYFPRFAAATCNTRAWAEKYAAFFGPRTDQIALKRNILMGIAEIQARVAWLERDLGSVRTFLAAA